MSLKSQRQNDSRNGGHLIFEPMGGLEEVYRRVATSGLDSTGHMSRLGIRLKSVHTLSRSPPYRPTTSRPQSNISPCYENIVVPLGSKSDQIDLSRSYSPQTYRSMSRSGRTAPSSALPNISDNNATISLKPVLPYYAENLMPVQPWDRIQRLNSSVWTFTNQASRLEHEKLALDKCRSLKRSSEIIPHRVDRYYYMAGAPKKIHNRYQVSDEDLKTLHEMSQARIRSRDTTPSARSAPAPAPPSVAQSEQTTVKRAAFLTQRLPDDVETKSESGQAGNPKQELKMNKSDNYLTPRNSEEGEKEYGITGIDITPREDGESENSSVKSEWPPVKTRHSSAGDWQDVRNGTPPPVTESKWSESTETGHTVENRSTAGGSGSENTNIPDNEDSHISGRGVLKVTKSAAATNVTGRRHDGGEVVRQSTMKTGGSYSRGSGLGKATRGGVVPRELDRIKPATPTKEHSIKTLKECSCSDEVKGHSGHIGGDSQNRLTGENKPGILTDESSHPETLPESKPIFRMASDGTKTKKEDVLGLDFSQRQTSDSESSDSDTEDCDSTQWEYKLISERRSRGGLRGSVLRSEVKLSSMRAHTGHLNAHSSTDHSWVLKDVYSFVLPEQKEVFERHFSCLDDNGNGVISRDELQSQLFENATQKDLDMFVKVFDLNRDFTVDLREFVTVAALNDKLCGNITLYDNEPLKLDLPKLAYHITAFKEMFDLLDTDGDLSLSVEELMIMMTVGISEQIGTDKSLASLIVKTVDVDHSGRIEFVEFLSFIPFFLGIYSHLFKKPALIEDIERARCAVRKALRPKQKYRRHYKEKTKDIWEE